MSAVVREGVSAEMSMEEHARIVDALLEDNADQPASAMLEHIERAQAKTLAVLGSERSAHSHSR